MEAGKEVREFKDFDRIYTASKCWAPILSYFVGLRGLKKEREGEEDRQDEKAKLKSVLLRRAGVLVGFQNLVQGTGR